MLKHLINFYKVSSPGPCNEVFIRQASVEISAMVYLSFGNFRIRYVLCLPVELECSKETDC